jgi:hypothetical protein
MCFQKRALSVLVLVILESSCARMFPNKVAAGVARLTVRDAAVLASLLEADTRCGFASPAVKDHPEVVGQKSGPGSATWTVKDCWLDLGKTHVVSTDCNGVTTEAGGRVILSATRTITGTVSGIAAQPIVPTAPDAASIDITAMFDDFVVHSGKSGLTIHSGGLKFNAVPQLAVSASLGVCAVPTGNALLQDLTYSASTVSIDDDGSIIDADVDGSSFSAQAGQGPKKENALWGTLSVWGERQGVPEPGDKSGLDPSYDAKAYQSSWACNSDLAQPLSTVCPSFGDLVAAGAARLTPLVFGPVAILVNNDTACGFSSQGVIGTAVATGVVGNRGGKVVTSLTPPCALTWPTQTVVLTDCNGGTISMEGTVLISGTRTVAGIVTGDPQEPAAPTTRDGVALEITLEFDHFSVVDSTGRGLRIASGSLSGTVTPRLAKDSTTGVCSIATPVTTYDGLKWTNAQIQLVNGDDTYDVRIDTSNLDAQNGPKDGHANTLAGTLVSNGKEIRPPATLDPTYDPVAFDKAYACTPNMIVPKSDDECGLYDLIGGGAARLLVETMGAATTRVWNDSKCGFQSVLVKLAPTAVTGGDGQHGSMSFHVDGCDVGASSTINYGTDCTDGKDSLIGKLAVSASCEVTGTRHRVVGVVNSITPDAPDSVTLNLGDVGLSEFATWHTPAGGTPLGKLTIHHGTMTGTVHPITAERASAPGSYDIGTPVAMLNNITLSGATATLLAGPKTFNLSIDAASINAMNGRWKGQGNSLSGSIRIDGHDVTLAEQPLDLQYTQARFDQSYACTTDMASLVPPQ